MDQTHKKPTAWLGWIYFAGLLMLLVGIFQVVAGFVALFQEDFYLVSSSELLLFNYSTWGWIHLFWGFILVLSSFSLLAGMMWGRVLAVILATISAIANFVFLPAYPLWATLVIVIDVFIIYAVMVHGREAQA